MQREVLAAEVVIGVQPEEAEVPIPQPQVMAMPKTERRDAAGNRKLSIVNHYFLVSQDPMFVKAEDWIEVVW